MLTLLVKKSSIWTRERLDIQRERLDIRRECSSIRDKRRNIHREYWVFKSNVLMFTVNTECSRQTYECLQWINERSWWTLSVHFECMNDHNEYRVFTSNYECSRWIKSVHFECMNVHDKYRVFTANIRTFMMNIQCSNRIHERSRRI